MSGSNDMFLIDNRTDSGSIPEITNIDSFANYMIAHPDQVWRNVAITDIRTPAFSFDIDYIQRANPCDNPLDIHFILACKNLSLGAQVALNCPQPGPNPMIKLEKSFTSNFDSQDLGIVSSIPSNWKGTITCNYWANRALSMREWLIDLHVVYFVNSAHMAFPNAKSVEELNIPSHLREGIGPQKGIVLESHRIVGQ